VGVHDDFGGDGILSESQRTSNPFSSPVVTGPAIKDEERHVVRIRLKFPNRVRSKFPIPANRISASGLALIVFSCGLEAAVVPVEMSFKRFTPENITINVGDTVVWTNPTDTLTDTESYGGEWNSGLLSQGASFSYTFDKPGPYVYRSRTYLVSASFAVAGTVKVQPWVNNSPVSRILSPVDAFYFTESQYIPISVLVASSENEIDKVEFFVGTQILGDVTNAPYTLVLTNAQPGKHVLTAQFIDKSGIFAVSPPVEITVDPFGISRFSSFRRLPHGEFFSNYNVPNGYFHCVETSEDLITWEVILRTSSGAGTFVDDTVTNLVHRFYRIRHCP
jgi:plastocyanin